MLAKLKPRFLILATAIAVAAFAGGAYAASQSGTNPRQAFLNDVAKRLNVTPQQLSAAIKGATTDQLNAAVKAGMLTQAQANAIEKRIGQGPGGPPFLGPRGFSLHGGLHGGLGPGLKRGLAPPGLFGPPGFGPPGAGPPGGGPAGKPPGAPIVAGPLGAAAKYLGLTPAQVLNDLGAKESLAAIAKARGKSIAGLEQAMLAPLKSFLDRAVSAGHLSKAHEQQLLSRLSDRIARRVNRTGIGLGARLRPGEPPPPSAFGGPASGPAVAPAPGAAPPAA